MDPQSRAAWLKQAARQHGFPFVGITRAERLEPERRRLEEWLNNGHHGKMAYMENHFELRTDPTQLVPGAKSVVSLLYNYYTEETQSDTTAPKLAMYAYGEDYHKVIRKKLKVLLADMRHQFGAINGRCFVDSGPVMERDLGKRAGIGWIGKNTLLINPKAGSWFFLAEIITDLELADDTPMQDRCGTCSRCIDACPTDAIAESGYALDATRCISYLTIELREEIPEAFIGKMENWVFGCDICQDVCPWNKFSTPHQEPAFDPSPELLGMESQDWNEISEEVFNRLFVKSAVRRTTYTGLRRNLDFIRKR